MNPGNPALQPMPHPAQLREPEDTIHCSAPEHAPRSASKPTSRRSAGGRNESALTLVELLVVIAMLALLAAILVPVLSRGKDGARLVQCIDNLRQLGLATQLYCDDHGGWTFPYLYGATNGGRRYWFGWLKPGAEGQREFDPTQGALYAELQGRGVELCPELDYGKTRYKLKAQAAAFSYGYNLHLGERPLNMNCLREPSGTILLADAAQVNDFQAPASAECPMLEEFYYVDADDGMGYPNAHFRHHRQATAVFGDGHVGRERAVPGSIDPRMPEAQIGRLRRDALVVP